MSQGRLFSGTILALSLLAGSPAWADGAYSVGSFNKRHHTFMLEVGMGWAGHYNLNSFASTPPQSYVGSARFSVWRGSFGIYGEYGQGLVAGVHNVDAGARIGFASLAAGRGASASGLSLCAIGGYSLRSFPASPTAAYPSSLSTVFYGVGTFWEFPSRGFFFSAELRASEINHNFFLLPYLGIGLQL